LVSTKPRVRRYVAHWRVGVFYTGKIQCGQDCAFLFKVVLETTKHTIFYPSSSPSLEVIALRLAV
jgi:hypothetical protein